MARRRKTAIEKAAEKAASLGIDLSDIKLPTTSLEHADSKSLEAEAVLLYFDLKGKGFEHQICPVCGNEFAYKYTYVMSAMRCSDRCRRDDLASKGIVWTPGRPLEERWAKGNTRGTLPVIVPSEALSAIRTAMGDLSGDV